MCSYYYYKKTNMVLTHHVFFVRLDVIRELMWCTYANLTKLYRHIVSNLGRILKRCCLIRTNVNELSQALFTVSRDWIEIRLFLSGRN